MRIAFVTPAYYPAIIGASMYCQTLASGLTKLGHEVDVFSNAPPNLEKEETVNGIKIRRFYPKTVGNYYISKGMLKALLKERYDIINSHHFGYYPATAGLIAAKLKKTKHVFGPYYHPPIYGTKRWLMFSAYHLTQGLPIIRFSERVLPHTEAEKKLLLKGGGKKKKRCPPSKQKKIQKVKTPKNFFFFLFWEGFLFFFFSPLPSTTVFFRLLY